jgi:hypothetical protein
VVFEGSGAILANNSAGAACSWPPPSMWRQQRSRPRTSLAPIHSPSTVPTDIAWSLDTTLAPDIDAAAPLSGTGPATIDVSLLENNSGEDKTHVIALGSKKVTLHQQVPPTVDSANPSEGPAEGGTEITIYGSNFKDGATVTIGGTAAASVMWVSSNELVAVTPPPCAG